jgi:hypothetical protein
MKSTNYGSASCIILCIHFGAMLRHYETNLKVALKTGAPRERESTPQRSPEAGPQCVVARRSRLRLHNTSAARMRVNANKCLSRPPRRLNNARGSAHNARQKINYAETINNTIYLLMYENFLASLMSTALFFSSSDFLAFWISSYWQDTATAPCRGR